ncbi:NADH-quinone oxidoreductase subunit M [Nakamurella sp. PAMC28650]|uniref:NADH-quinone oxidoreductase subunit M n=1 Tax=Nakamurella sp. PAMC28650 TaxID=2762325 RepID=UPI00164E892D|nr:NADH-quinone oxidoreductase subunit M [Nakamurella sp. PAMC28650]QNK82843.1 NADH-quinone oxidoreductase subunit M [Nakamurella sp. PAMC28650]
MSNFPYLVLLIAIPLVGAGVVAFMGGAPARTVKLTALAFSLVELVVAAALWIAYRHQETAAPTTQYAASPFRETYSVNWIQTFGIHFSLGVDGISLVMIALIAFLVPIVLGASWEEKLPEGRTIGGYFALILVMQAAMTGVFAATDVFVFYVMFEVMLIPMYFLIGAFGGLRGTYAATKFFLYSLIGGLLMLASIIGLFVASGRVPSRVAAGLGGTLDWNSLRNIAHEIPTSTQLWIFGGFAIAFAIKAPLVPFHTWLPDAGSEAPVGAGTLLVGVLDKVGTFGFLRICLPLLPAASSKLAWLIITLAVIGIIYGAIVAAGQSDLKRFVTYTSIAHFGFIALGVFAFTTSSISGAVLYMVNHGLATALLFLVVGMLTARGGSRNIADYGGVWKVAPLLGGFFLVGALATIAMPGTNSFISEFMVLIGTFSRHPAWASVATTGIVFAAVYMLWIFQRTMTGPVRGAAVLQQDPHDDSPLGGSAPQARPGGTTTMAKSHAPAAVKVRFGDLTTREIAVLTPLVVLVIFLGLYPKPVLDVINPTAQQTVSWSCHTDPVPAHPAPAVAGSPARPSTLIVTEASC